MISASTWMSTLIAGVLSLTLSALANASPDLRCLERLASGNNHFQETISLSGLKKLAAGFDTYKDHIENPSRALFVDYTRNSKARRAFMIDFQKCDVVAFEHVIHGGAVYTPVVMRDGDPDDDGRLDKCLNRYGTRTNMTRPGLYLTGGCHETQKGFPKITTDCKAIRLYGLESRNEDARRSGVVLHEHFNIPDDESIKPVGQGCPAFPPGRLKSLLKYGIWSGTLVYVHAPQCDHSWTILTY